MTILKLYDVNKFKSNKNFNYVPNYRYHRRKIYKKIAHPRVCCRAFQRLPIKA